MDDLIERVAGIQAGSAVAALRLERAEIRDRAQGAYLALVRPESPGGIGRGARAALARRVAAAEGDAALADAYAGMGGDEGDGRFGALAAYAEVVAARPEAVDQGRIDALRAAGLSVQDVVAVTQLAAFVPYQVRVIAGVRALAGAAGRGAPAAMMRPGRYTMAEVGWVPRVPPVVAETASPAQLAALEACPPAVRRSTYFLTLAQDPASLEERGALFNSVMYAPRGLKRVERELATAAVSLVNGCVYCTSVHARRFVELSGDEAVMRGLLEEGLGAPLDARRRAIVDFAGKLTASPGAVGAEDLAALREAGMAELELLDLVHAVAMFANANRLMQALGDAG